MSWQQRLGDAASERAVVEAVKDFVATLEHDTISRLPVELRPGKFFDANDITTYAFALVRHDCGDDDTAKDVVHRLAAFFAQSSIRLSQIMARSNEDDEDSRESA